MHWLDKQKVKQSDDDADYDPKDDDNYASSSGSDSETLKEFAARNVQRKMDREKIVKGIKSLSPSASPTKEALKIRLQQAELKLQMLLDSENENGKAKDKQGFKPDSKKQSRENNMDGMILKDDGKKDEQINDLEDDGKHLENNDAFNESSKHSERNDPFNESSKSEINDAFNESSKHSENNDPFNDSSKHSENNDALNDSVKDHGSTDLFIDEHDEKKTQMYGNCEGSILLNSNVYCNKRVLKEALTKSTNVCHIARRLLVGVFKPEALQSCTLTGQEWRAGPSDRKSSDALYQPGVDAIIEYAKTAAIQRKWKVPKADTPIKHSMSCRLGELKRMIKDHGIAALKKKYL
ncbi:Halomucin [Frankliniella fusca]|uniref:Halomucin n=1 Tax=Frankliniella fusca TaxID=407009 RepID=A0AAE1GTU2_9NEOP|nr:Halomucin [Frankliniella fusca]